VTKAHSILRKGRFRLQGRQQIPAGGHANRIGGQSDDRAEEIAEQIEGDLPSSQPFGRAAQARIIEQAGGICVIEVTCSCGEVLHLQCYVDASAGSNSQINPTE
jgi:hypothetical protein